LEKVFFQSMEQKKIGAWVQLVSLVIAAVSTGVLAGITFERWRFFENREPVEIGDFSEEISLLTFDSIENGVLKGRLEGEEARIVIAGKDEVTSVFPGEFAFSITEILPLLQKIPAPDEAAFVASKNGKYFYPLDAPEAALLTVKNRIFFTDEEQAQNAGFVRNKK
jgi:hypothetical protein